MEDLKYFYYETNPTNDINGAPNQVFKIKVESITKCQHEDLSKQDLYFINKYLLAYNRDIIKSKQLENSGVEAEESTLPVQKLEDFPALAKHDLLKKEYYPVFTTVLTSSLIGKKKTKEVHVASNTSGIIPYMLIVNGEAFMSLSAFLNTDLTNVPEIE